MENYAYGAGKEEERMNLPPGFRFFPTDEELISDYLYNKVINISFTAVAIGEVDLNKSEPWDLPWKAKMGEREWYFFSQRDRKYPTGQRTNRATASGYWKATGKDKEICYRGKLLVGMKKTLVFYKGRAPKGEKTNWVMHEYRLDGKLSVKSLPKTAKNDWVICRVFQKSHGGKKIHISGLAREEFTAVSCYSNPTTNLQTAQQDAGESLINSHHSNWLFHNQPVLGQQNLQQYPGSVLMQDDSIFRTQFGSETNQHGFKPERDNLISVSQETCLTSDMNTEISSVISNLEQAKMTFQDRDGCCPLADPVDLDCLWNY